MHVYMTRVISLSDEAYEELKKLKAGRSFSEIVLRIARERAENDIVKFAGILTDEEGEEMKKKIYEERKLKSRRFQ